MDDYITNFRQWFRNKLKNDTATIVFEKLNGDMREMRCTLDLVYDEDPALTESVDKPNQVVWDLDVEGWRSFRWETLTSYQFGSDKERTAVEHQEEMFTGM